MFRHSRSTRRFKVTVVAFVWLFFNVRFHMLLHTACMSGCIITLVAFVSFFFRYGFSNVTSIHLDQSMHIHTGCICLTFLRCVISNVSSTCLPQRMHSHIGYICLFFSPLCLFKCVLKCPAFEDVYLHWLHLFIVMFWPFFVTFLESSSIASFSVNSKRSMFLSVIFIGVSGKGRHLTFVL